MNRDKIGKYSWAYALLRGYVRLMHYLYYGRLRVKGREHIPVNTPIIFAPNHQNALMDALAVLFTYPRQMVFLARSDIFSKPFVARILTFFKIMPIYRIRDGYSALQSNNEIFDKTVELMQDRVPLVILPEGNHAGWRRLRPFKKGIARIAFQAEESRNFELGIRIVPVGLDYSRYEKSGAELLVKYGPPIKVADFEELYKENPARANHALLQELSQRLSPLMVDIRSEEHYEMIDIVRRCYAYSLMRERGERSAPWSRHNAEIEAIKLCEQWLDSAPAPEEIAALYEDATAYRVALGYHKLQFRNPEEGLWPWWKIIGQWLLFLAAAPLFVYGFVNNILPVLFPKMVVKRVKDVQFQSTFKFGLSIFTVPIFYGIQTLLFGLLAPLPPLFTLYYFISLPLSGFIAIRYRLFFRRYLARVRFRILSLFQSDAYRNLLAMKQKIEHAMAAIRQAS
jgi:1-acyl-sn-glycerol-3-phosphate acyltransferase